MTEYIELAQRVGQSLSDLLSDGALAFDYVLLYRLKQASDGWLDITDLLPMMPETDDEAIVAYASRKHCSALLDVSEDGAYVRRLTPFPDHTLLDARTVYVERLPSSSTDASIRLAFDSFGQIEQVVVPRHGGIAKRFPGYAFVVFVNSDSADKAVQHYSHSWKPMTSTLNIPEFLKCEATSPSGYRVMTKIEWNVRTMEYALLQSSKQELLVQTKADQLGQHHHATFVSGVVCAFGGVHKDTTAKYIKNLFEIVSPIAFVDFKFGQNKGHVRFKTAYDALKAESFFSRQSIIQSHKSCTGVIASNLNPTLLLDESCISIRILKGREEKEYWRLIRNTQGNTNVITTTSQNQKRNNAASHVTFNDADENTTLDGTTIIDASTRDIPMHLENSKPQPPKKHIKFDVSESGEEEDAIQDGVVDGSQHSRSTVSKCHFPKRSAADCDETMDHECISVQNTHDEISAKRPRRRRKHSKRSHNKSDTVHADTTSH
ncbi:hypothetical protein BASA61_003249 [Batrachochytrium salamandrivorans]|nr:hypothetical protein BASA62_009430 [Batrachochytrium salamandrivorans]KAH6597114.1 hypothetical protein BASA61_003249 [Batrachochytrium salamandrivorans]